MAALNVKITSLPANSPARVAAEAQVSSAKSQLNALNGLVATLTK